MGRDRGAALTQAVAAIVGRGGPAGDVCANTGTTRGLASIGVAAMAVARATLDFLLPRACVCCDRLLDAGDAGCVCGRCWSRVAWLPHPQCARCGHPSRSRGTCRWCAQLSDAVALARSLCWMHQGTGAQIVHALKYRGWHGAAGEIGARMARASWPDAGLADRIVVPVPLAASRERERGFNQSERIARALALRWRAPLVARALERVRSTGTQTRLTPEERLANVSGAFRLRDASRKALRNAHVVLVDDVVTTGATLNACAAALREGGARFVSFITFGRAPAQGDR